MRIYLNITVDCENHVNISELLIVCIQYDKKLTLNDYVFYFYIFFYHDFYLINAYYVRVLMIVYRL